MQEPTSDRRPSQVEEALLVLVRALEARKSDMRRTGEWPDNVAVSFVPRVGPRALALLPREETDGLEQQLAAIVREGWATYVDEPAPGDGLPQVDLTTAGVERASALKSQATDQDS